MMKRRTRGEDNSGGCGCRIELKSVNCDYDKLMYEGMVEDRRVRKAEMLTEWLCKNINKISLKNPSRIN